MEPSLLHRGWGLVAMAAFLGFSACGKDDADPSDTGGQPGTGGEGDAAGSGTGGGSAGTATGGVSTGGATPGGSAGTPTGGAAQGGSAGTPMGGATPGGSAGTAGSATGGAPEGGAGTGGTVTYGPPGPSCDELTGTECQGESCCASILAPGGSFMMGRSPQSTGTDYFAGGYSYEVPEHSVTVDAYYLDKYEVTVNRFRAFVEQYEGTPPAAGAAAHPSIAGTGWNSAWDAELPATQAALMARLKCSGTYQTWTDAPGANETKPINCVDWYAAVAFCAWDGGRLPTEAEWEYAAAGGEENRLYPWGATTPDETLAVFDCCADGTCATCAFTDLLAVGSRPGGNARWGHSDLAGSVWEWTFDWWADAWYGELEASGTNVCNLTADHGRVVRGSHFMGYAVDIRAATRQLDYYPTVSDGILGFRCARTP